jgi:hypothetical protein
MALSRRKQEPVTPEPEANEEIVSRIEEWLPGLEAPLTWVRTVDLPSPDDDTEETDASEQIRRSA